MEAINNREFQQEVEQEHWKARARMENDICEFCGKPWNSEYHMSDECVKGGGDEDGNQ